LVYTVKNSAHPFSFYSIDHPNDIKCTARHKRPCKHCTQGYRILVILDKRAKTKGLAAKGVLEKQQIDEMQHEIVLAKEDLDEYRSHLSRLKTEADFDQKELDELADDSAKVISDWKMKLLACYFRENQGRFLGKRGVSLLEFMIASNLRDEESRAAGLKDVRFVMMITDDTLQDDWSAMCTKHEIYSNHLPESQVSIRWRGLLQQYAQPHCSSFLGCLDRDRGSRICISPGGGGKSQLDGMFATFGQVMSSSVDSGASY
jgi:hypothetical protein